MCFSWQIGQPAGREQYVRRVTLSGQETKERQCILLLMSHEQPFLKQLSGVPLWELESPQVNSATEAKVSICLDTLLTHIAHIVQSASPVFERLS